MKVSVVLATYQGEKYLIEQLDSIRNQTYPIDEVIIKDDCSSDSTKTKILNFIGDNGLSDWKFIQNDKNEGWKKNFKNGIYMSTGDIIFLCDQDDIWEYSKIEKMIRVFEINDEVELLVSGFTKLGDKKIENDKSLNTLRRIPIDSKFVHNEYPGCVYGFRKELFNKMLPYWNDTLPHDQQLWLISNIRNSLFLYDESLIFYRRHNETATGRDKLSRNTKVRNIEYEYQGLRCIEKYINENIIDNNEKKLIDKVSKYVCARKAFFDRRTLMTFLKTIPNIRSYFSFKTFLGDIYVNLFM